MARKYEVKETGDKILIGRLVDNSPGDTVWYMLTARDLFASIQAMDTMGVYSRKQRPGHIVQIYFSDEDVERAEDFASERPKKTTD